MEEQLRRCLTKESITEYLDDDSYRKALPKNKYCDAVHALENSICTYKIAHL